MLKDQRNRWATAAEDHRVPILSAKNRKPQATICMGSVDNGRLDKCCLVSEVLSLDGRGQNVIVFVLFNMSQS